MLTIIGGSHLAGEICSTRDKHVKNAKAPPSTYIYKTEEQLAKHTQRKREDIVFTKADARWVHHPYVDVLVITAQIANSNVH